VRDLLTALALALVLEGVAYALFPAAMQRMVAAILAMPASSLRMAGLVMATLGVAGVWLVRAATLGP
jgi:uncharacterized protein YjeT (DUF2065 family)